MLDLHVEKFCHMFKKANSSKKKIITVQTETISFEAEELLNTRVQNSVRYLRWSVLWA